MSVSKSFSLLPAGQLVVPPAVGLLLGLPDGASFVDGVALGLPEGEPPADGVLPADGVPVGVADGVPAADGVSAGEALGVPEGVAPLPADGVAAGVALGMPEGVAPLLADGVPLGAADGVLLGGDGAGLPMVISMLMLPAVGGAVPVVMHTSSIANCTTSTTSVSVWQPGRQ